MSHIQRALLILGSPRALQESTSESLGGYLLELLEGKGVETTRVHAHRSVRTLEGMQALFDNFDNADLVILSCPLYVDSLPAPVIHVMEGLQEHWKLRKHTSKGFVAIVNCGFPEALHTEVSLAICRRFAQETGLGWRGGLGLGGGEALGGKSLDQAGWLARNVRRSLQLAAAALQEDKHVPQKAIDLISKPLVPAWLYRWLGNRGWNRQAKRYGVKDEVMARPFQ